MTIPTTTPVRSTRPRRPIRGRYVLPTLPDPTCHGELDSSEHDTSQPAAQRGVDYGPWDSCEVDPAILQTPGEHAMALERVLTLGALTLVVPVGTWISERHPVRVLHVPALLRRDGQTCPEIIRVSLDLSVEADLWERHLCDATVAHLREHNATTDRPDTTVEINDGPWGKEVSARLMTSEGLQDTVVLAARGPGWMLRLTANTQAGLLDAEAVEMLRGILAQTVVTGPVER